MISRADRYSACRSSGLGEAQKGKGSPEHFMFLGRAGVGDQPDAIVAGVQDITTGGQHGCESRWRSGQRS